MAKQTIPRLLSHAGVSLSSAQERLWFLDQLEPNSCVYNTPRAWRLAGQLNTSALQQALDAIVARHEVLRTNFSTGQNERPVQVIHESGTVELPLVDLSSACEREAELERLLCAEARRPFDLAKDPMLRAKLFRLAQEDHVLCCTMHHIATDGWSQAVLYDELAAFYNSYSQHTPVTLAELAIQYADYAVWQRQYLQGEVLERHVGYWKKRLKDAPGLLNLPTARPRPAVQTYNGARRSTWLPKSLIEGLRAVSQRQQGTLFMTMLAAWQTLLHRYTHQTDILVGVPTAGRKHVETERLIGFFVNTLVLRGNLSGDPTFSELLGQMRQTSLEAYQHDELPFEKLVEELHPDRNLSHSPLFQVMFAFQNLPKSSAPMSGLEITNYAVQPKIAKFDMTLFITSTADAMAAIIEYNTDLFEGETIDRMLGHYRILLQGIVANPEQRISELPLLTEEEGHQLLVEWNNTERKYPKDKCIHQLFEEQVARTPEAVALVFEEHQLTYRELNNRANQLAHYLTKQGVGPEVLVGLCVERSVEMVVGLLGVLKAGGAYVPLDPEYPEERLKCMLEDTLAPVLLTRQTKAAGKGWNIEYRDARLAVICLDREWKTIERELAENLGNSAGADNLAYAIYTSGSTGQPKGVMIPHRALVNHMRWMQECFRFTASDGVVQKTALSFDASVWEIFAPLMAGARLILAAPQGHQDAGYLVQLVRKSGATILQLVPSMLRIVLQEKQIRECDTLRILFSGGEALTKDIEQQVFERLDCRLHNLYGPTEACIDTISWECRNDSTRSVIPIGRPIANTQVYILDAFRNPVPIGVVGEIYIGGDGVARGYLNRRELTAEKFITHCFDGEPARRLYKTGDQARYWSDGNIELLGRIDNQVKIRGYRIELGEIEAVLAQHPAVRECAVVAREEFESDNPKSQIGNPKFLVAYVVAQGECPNVGDLRQYLKAKLPDYMVPSAFVFLDSMPLTANGKVDRKALPDPSPDSSELSAAYVAPRNAAEEIIAMVWSEVLGRKEIGVHDNFFDLGGYSLKATQVVARLRVKFRAETPLRHLFEYPTVAELATVITENADRETTYPENLDLLLTEIEAMTDEEAQRLLLKKSDVRTRGIPT